MAKISIVVPFHWMKNWHFFLTRCLQSIEQQTFKDYEVILTKVGSMPVTSNRAISAAKGELVKILLMDDYLAHPDSLQEIVDNFKGDWLLTGCLHKEKGKPENNPHYPTYSDDIHLGNNTIGPPSVLTFKRDDCLYFDENLSWLVDCDFYKRLYDKYGPPTILNTPNVVIGLHEGQATHRIPFRVKQDELDYMLKKFA